MIPFADPRVQPLDANGKPIPGAQLSFFDAGTSNPRTVYADYLRTTPLTQPVIADSAGRFPVIFEPTGQYKMVLADANSVTIYTADNLDGPFDPSTLSATNTVLTLPAISRTTTGSIATTDLAKLIVCDTSGGSFTQTLPLVSASASKPAVIRKQSATGTLSITAAGADVIYSAAGSVTTYQMSTNGSSIMLVPSGGGWYVWEQLAIAASDGTAALPAFAFASQAGVGMFKAASNALGFATAALQRLLIDAAGNLTLGADGTAQSVTVPGNQASLTTGRPTVDNAQLKLGSQTTTQGGGVEFEVSGASNGSGWKVASPNFASGADSGSLLILGRNNNSAWSEVARFSQAGNLGVGNNNPAYPIDAPSIRASSVGFTFPDATVQASAAKGNYAPDVIVEHQLASGTPAGNATASAWETRPLNTLVRNNNSIAALASNQVTLPAGTFYVACSAPVHVYSLTGFNGVDHFTQFKVRNITDSVDYMPSPAYEDYFFGTSLLMMVRTTWSGVFTLSASKALALQSYTNIAGTSNSWGASAGLGFTEIYARMEIWKIA